MSLSSKIYEVFEECQLNYISHDRLCSKLINIYCQMPFSDFADDFFELTRYSLVSGERSGFREKTIDFITKFALSCGKQNGSTQNILNNRLLLKCFLFCMKYNECSNPAVRFRCMQIIRKLLDGIGDNGVLPGGLYNKLKDILLRRVYDVKAYVRVQAVHALSRMQDPEDADCEVVQSFVWLAQHDPTADGRKAAIESMVLTTRTLPIVIDRCRDVTNGVRCSAYKLLSGRKVLKPLTIASRIRILHDGLSDRFDDVRNAAQDLLMVWFDTTDRDPVKLLRRLDTEGVAQTSQLALDHLLVKLSLDDLSTVVDQWVGNYLTDERVIKTDSCSVEVAFFWRVLLEFLYKKQKAELCCKRTGQSVTNATETNVSGCIQHMLDTVQPSIGAYINFLEYLVDQFLKMARQHANIEDDVEALEEHTCVLNQVLSMARWLDFSDEFNRKRLVTLVHGWIVQPQVPSSLAPHLLKLYGILEKNFSRRLNNLVEMVGELCDAVDSQQQQHLSEPSSNAVANQQGESSTQSKVASDNLVAASKNAKEIRLKIANLDVRIDEINESMYECVVLKKFERATELRDECDALESKRLELVNTLHDKVPPRVSTCTNTGNNDSVANNLNKTQQNDTDSADEEDDALKTIVERCSVGVLLKANRIVSLLFQQSSTLWKLPISLRQLLETLILPSIQHTDPTVRNQAMLALGLYCASDLNLSVQYLPLFYTAMHVDQIAIKETALRSIGDCFLIFGFKPFHEANVTNVTTTTCNTLVDHENDEYSEKGSDHVVVITREIVNEPVENSTSEKHNRTVLVHLDYLSDTAWRLLKPIVALLDCEDDKLRTTSAFALTKLLIYNRILSRSILSRLLLLWFNPISENTPNLRRVLACFFSDYACGTASSMGAFGHIPNSVTYEHQSSLGRAVVPTLSALMSAPSSSLLSEVDENVVAGLLVRMTDTTHLRSQNDSERNPTSENCSDVNKIDNPHHDYLALVLRDEILKDPKSTEAKLYIRMLCQLRFTTGNVKVYREIFLLLCSIIKMVDRSSGLMIHRFRKQLILQFARLGLEPPTPQPSAPLHKDNDVCDLDKTLTSGLVVKASDDPPKAVQSMASRHITSVLTENRSNLRRSSRHKDENTRMYIDHETEHDENEVEQSTPIRRSQPKKIKNDEQQSAVATLSKRVGVQSESDDGPLTDAPIVVAGKKRKRRRYPRLTC